MIYATGRRKSASARVFLTENGNGNMFINGNPSKKHFEGRRTQKMFIDMVMSAAKESGIKINFDIQASVKGGGVNAQAQAISHGLACALVKHEEKFYPNNKEQSSGLPSKPKSLSVAQSVDNKLLQNVTTTQDDAVTKLAEETKPVATPTTRNKLHDKLRKSRYITRDSRQVERKKVGKRKARKLKQFSKR